MGYVGGCDQEQGEIECPGAPANQRLLLLLRFLRPRLVSRFAFQNSGFGFRRPGEIHVGGLSSLKRPSFWASPLLLSFLKPRLISRFAFQNSGSGFCVMGSVFRVACFVRSVFGVWGSVCRVSDFVVQGLRLLRPSLVPHFAFQISGSRFRISCFGRRTWWFQVPFFFARLSFRVPCFVFRVSDFMVPGSECRVSCFRFHVSGSMFRVPRSIFRVSDLVVPGFVLGVPNCGLGVPDSRLRVPDFMFRVSGEATGGASPKRERKYNVIILLQPY